MNCICGPNIRKMGLSACKKRRVIRAVCGRYDYLLAKLKINNNIHQSYVM